MRKVQKVYIVDSQKEIIERKIRKNAFSFCEIHKLKNKGVLKNWVKKM